jgi:hypothetical protein
MTNSKLKPRTLLVKRDFLGDDVWRNWKQDEESLLQFRNQVAAKGGKPGAEDIAQIRANKA